MKDTNNPDLATAIQKIVDITTKPDIKKVHTTEDKDYFFLIPGGGGAATILDYPRQAPNITRTLLSRDSFEHYVKCHNVEEDTECYVSPSTITAYFNPKAHSQHVAKLPLEFHEDYQALMKITNPIQQKPLWRILSTILVERMPAGLLLLVNELKAADNANAEVQIAATGLSKESYSREVTVSFKNAKGTGEAKEVQVDWHYKGPIYDCTPAVYEIPLRMELSVPKPGDPLHFQFHPIGLGEKLRNAQADIRDQLAQDLSPIPIYDGH